MQKYVCWEGGTGQWEMLIYGMISGNGCSKSWEGNDLREILFVYIRDEQNALIEIRNLAVSPWNPEKGYFMA